MRPGWPPSWRTARWWRHTSSRPFVPASETSPQPAVAASDARALIERGALVASRGGRIEDWEGLAAWFDPASGRAARFAMRLVRALPGMHANLRRLHTSRGMATSRSRALAARLTALDEVPSEVDEEGREGLARYIAELDLDLIATSHHWDGAPGAWDGMEAYDLESAPDGTVVAFPMLVRGSGPLPGDTDHGLPSV